MPPLRKVLIANRGEIAVRVLRACQDLNIDAVVAYSETDEDTLAVRLASEAVCIGPGPASRSYANTPALISAALVTGCDALHPGYGFLAENAYLAEICEKIGIEFVGPTAEVISSMGDKAKARSIMRSAKVATVPGSDGAVKDIDTAQQIAEKIGFPVLVKAVAGGGGRGMRPANNPSELSRRFSIAQNEAESAFGSGAVYLEKIVENARHIEVQVLSDKHGHHYAIGERDCSLQRRHQKLVEEAPAPGLNKKVRDNLLKAAVKASRAVDYRGAGTIEFLVDDKDNFYFIEMNTRIQVEHPITERVSGLDLVAWQLLIASGQELKLNQKEIAPRGHAIECRITAEDPSQDFQPSAGTIISWFPPGGPGIRVDSHMYTGYHVPPNYDSLLAKVIAWGETRDQAIARMNRALAELEITGVPTTTEFLRMVISDERFRRGEINTNFIPDFMARNSTLIERLRYSPEDPG